MRQPWARVNPVGGVRETVYRNRRSDGRRIRRGSETGKTLQGVFRGPLIPQERSAFRFEWGGGKESAVVEGAHLRASRSKGKHIVCGRGKFSGFPLKELVTEKTLSSRPRVIPLRTFFGAVLPRCEQGRRTA